MGKQKNLHRKTDCHKYKAYKVYNYTTRWNRIFKYAQVLMGGKGQARPWLCRTFRMAAKR